MPYKRRFKKRRYRKRYKKSAYSLAKKALARSKTEKKYVTIQTGSTAVGTAGTFHLLNAIIRGDANDERDGIDVYLKSLDIRMILKSDTDIDGAAALRYVVFLDMQSNGVAPTIAELFTVGSSNTLLHFNESYRHRFKILRDKTMTINPINSVINATTNVVTTGEAIKYHKRYIKVKQPVKYFDTDFGDIRDVTTGALYILLVSNNSGNSPEINLHARVCFYDS